MMQGLCMLNKPSVCLSNTVVLNLFTTSYHLFASSYQRIYNFFHINELYPIRDISKFVKSFAKFKLESSYSRNHKLKSTIVHSSMRRFTASLEKTCSNFITIVCFLDQNFNRGHSKIICVLQVYVLSCFKLTEKWLYLLFSVRSGLPYLYPVALTISPRSRK